MSLYDAIHEGAPEQPAPKGWEPYAEQSGQIGSAVVKLPRPDATKRDLLIASGFNPDQWAIKGDINVRRWMRHDQEWLYYYRFDTVEVESGEARQANIEELVGLLYARRRPAERPPTFGNDAWLYCASDWQIGKGEGDGTAGTVQRVLDSIDDAVLRVRELRRAGRLMPQGGFVATGDLGEGTCGFYPNQLFSVDCTRREANRLTRMLITTAVDALSPLFDDFTVLTVGGNHGENRQDGKKVTDDSDNDDVAQFECVKEAFDKAGHDHLEWVIPHDELSLLHTFGGVPVGFTHGHLFTAGGKLPQAKALEWWKSQDFGFQPVRDAKILVSSHFHHFTATSHGARTHFQTPACDPGSKWVRNAWGSDTPAGVLTFRVDSETPLGWDDLQILGA